MSVREKYRETINELRRADSVPERFGVFRRLWAWLICKSRNSTTVFGIFLIPVYLIAIGVWKYGECGAGGDSVNISLWLIITGSVILICALYLPLRKYAKKKARQARGQARSGVLVPDFLEKLSEEEISRQMPGHMDRICNFAFFALCGILPKLTIYTFRVDAVQCAPIIYWTAFVISVLFCIWLGIILSACFLGCCLLVACPKCTEKCEEDVEVV